VPVELSVCCTEQRRRERTPRIVSLAKIRPRGPTSPTPFDTSTFPDAATVPRRVVRFAFGTVVFAQGARANSLFFIQTGGIRLSVLSAKGRETVVARLGPGDFFGEGCLAGQPRRMGTATATVPTVALRIQKRDMVRTLHGPSAFADRFIAHMLVRNIRIEEDLIDQLFNSSEKRLARTLLFLARYGQEGTASRKLPALSPERLAEMVGTTRPRIDGVMNKFRKLGFIDTKGGVTVNNSLLSVVLHN
jgi:CRP-like cAMP-binding protein